MSQAAWASSGAMALTGRADGPPLIAPTGVVAEIVKIGAAGGVDALALVGERAALAGLSRRGATSCGGMTRLLRAADGVLLAVSLARADDVALLPAWLGVSVPPSEAMDDDAWGRVRVEVAQLTAPEVVARATLVGLPVAAVGEIASTPPVVSTSFGVAPLLERVPFVVDLSSLWAGPLATRLLLGAGARVIKVESISRPDGARHGNEQFFHLMNAGKESVALDLRAERGIGQLRRLIAQADVVVEASRPRAMEQLGIDAAALVTTGPRVWLSITGYGRSGPERNRVAFGDDAAIAGGLVADVGDGPCFVADAIADPLTGIVAASAVADALRAGTRVVLDVALTRVAARVAGAAGGERWREGSGSDTEPPPAPRVVSPAPGLGQHTDAVLRELL